LGVNIYIMSMSTTDSPMGGPASVSFDSRRSSVIPELALSGYLYKKTRENKWQKRYFETQQFYLTYYKNRKMEKLLAALHLPQVGDIRIMEGPDVEPGTFCLELNTRVYTLRANDIDTANMWVNTLTRLREQGKVVPSQEQNTVGSLNTSKGVDPGVPKQDDWLKVGKQSCCESCAEKVCVIQ
jgi:hypothetical protein